MLVDVHVQSLLSEGGEDTDSGVAAETGEDGDADQKIEVGVLILDPPTEPDGQGDEAGVEDG